MKTKSTFQNLMRRAAMMMLAVLTTAAWAQTVYTVTLTAGDGSGSDVTLNSTDNYYGESDNGSSVPNGQFFTSDGQLWFKIPDCPGSFSAPSGKVFTKWDLNGDDWNPGNYLQMSGDVTLTAQWAEAGNAKLLSLTPSQGTLDPQFDPDNTGYNLDVLYNGTPVSVTVQVVAQDPNATVEYQLDLGSSWQNTCPPMTVEDNELYIKVTNGANEETYYVILNIIYTLTLTTEGEGTAKAKAFFGNVERYTGSNEEMLVLEATPATGWNFKEWQLVSGDGTLSNATSQNDARYRFNKSNAEVKAVFEREPVTAITLADNADNTAALNGRDGQTLDVTLDGRTLYCDGDWNTLCLPFSVSDLAGTPLDGFTVKELDTETAYDGHVTGLDGTTLYLNFKDATGIEAGKPYLVKKVVVDEESTPTYTATAGTAGTLTQQGYANLVDGSMSGNRWRTSSVPAYCEFHSDKPVYVTGYTLTTGNQSANYDPTAWTLQAKQNEDDAWTVIDSRNVSENASDALPSGRTAGKAYTIQQPGAYQYFRFDVSATTDGNILCLTELTLNAKHLAMGADIVNPTFIDVTVSDEEPVPVGSAGGIVNFKGSFRPVTLWPGSGVRNFYIDDDNNFCWPKEASYTLNAFRAYFELSGIGVNELSDVVNNVGLNFEGETTGIVNVNDNETLRYENDNYWYSLDGGKLSEKPTAKGVYIHNGIKVVIK